MRGCSKSKSSLTANPLMFSKHYLTLITHAETLLLLLQNCCSIVNSTYNYLAIMKKLSYKAVSLFNLLLCCQMLVPKSCHDSAQSVMYWQMSVTAGQAIWQSVMSRINGQLA